ncbi:GNAT family N-acetyltransferase [Hymenobacter crusticola]|uniref:N-acetyltransferase domain-containing protein n=1 Tax=Hymenobacter crusticola TaxID=1770526 RepID=A0A2C9ZTY8_9BACT|nr:GNAT family N-acetyltransferase [Hymenobacter crusticola]OUJ70172.1 hypothetical protein BXP70_25315 [Hymenobacter crusticola]
MSKKISLLDCTIENVRSVKLACIEEHLFLGGAEIMLIDDGTPTLSSLFVHPHYRRRGIGEALVRAAMRWADQNGTDLWLHVMLENEARSLYERLLFEYTGEKTEIGSFWMVKVAHDGRLAEPADVEKLLAK